VPVVGIARRGTDIAACLVIFGVIEVAVTKIVSVLAACSIIVAGGDLVVGTVEGSLGCWRERVQAYAGGVGDPAIAEPVVIVGLAPHASLARRCQPVQGIVRVSLACYCRSASSDALC